MNLSIDLLNLKARNNYFVHTLGIRCNELRSAYHRLAHLAQCCHVDQNGQLIQLKGSTLTHNVSECRVPDPTAENVSHDQCESLLKSTEQEEQLMNSSSKDNNTSLMMVTKASCHQCEHLQINVDVAAKANQGLEMEITRLQINLQKKEEALAQAIFEKDELEDAVGVLRCTVEAQSEEISHLKSSVTWKSSCQCKQEIDKLKDEKCGLIEQLEVLGAELTCCLEPSQLLNASQQMDCLASQSASQTSSAKLELLTLQAEKDDLEQKLTACQTELMSAQSECVRCNRLVQSLTQTVESLRRTVAGLSANKSELDVNLSCKSIEVDEMTDKLNTYESQLKTLETQNAELLAQLLVLEDRLTESENLVQESSRREQQTLEQLEVAQQKLTDACVQIEALEVEKRQLVLDLNNLKTRAERSEIDLKNSRAQLTLLDSKLKATGNHCRNLLCQREQLEAKLNLFMQSSDSTVSEHRTPCIPTSTTTAAESGENCTAAIPARITDTARRKESSSDISSVVRPPSTPLSAPVSKLSSAVVMKDCCMETVSKKRRLFDSSSPECVAVVVSDSSTSKVMGSPLASLANVMTSQRRLGGRSSLSLQNRRSPKFGGLNTAE